MGILSTGFSAIGRLAAVGLLSIAFLFGLAGVVYMSLQGTEVMVPEITGKDFLEGEKELALLGLKIKKRADRNSTDAPNTVIEQLPKPGETVKTGQLILVITSKGEAENGEKTTTLKKTKDDEEDDAEKIEEMIDDKPKRPKSNSNTTRKKADTTRDVTANSSDSNIDVNSNSKDASSNSNKKETGSNNNSSEKSNKNALPPTIIKVPSSGAKPSGEPRNKVPTRP